MSSDTNDRSASGRLTPRPPVAETTPIASATGAVESAGGDTPQSPSAVGTPAAAGSAPARPPVSRVSTAPVIVKIPPPFSVRLAQFLWIVAIAVAGFTAVYLFVIRQTQLPLIADIVRGVVPRRPEATYASAADIVFWCFFGALVAVVLAQITLLVSFMGRRPRIRWWQFATLVVQLVLLVLSAELIALGDRGEVLLPLLAIQCGLVALALLSSILPNAIAWSARQHDLRPAPEAPAASDF